MIEIEVVDQEVSLLFGMSENVEHIIRMGYNMSAEKPFNGWMPTVWNGIHWEEAKRPS